MKNPLRIKILTSVALICFFVFMIQGLKYSLHSSYVYSAEEVKKGKTKGVSTAKLRIVEYSDFQCPSCSKGALILNKLYEQFPKEITIEFNHFPLTTIHKHALTASVFANCASRQNKFWDFHDFIFENQKEWAHMEEVRTYFIDKVKEMDIDMTEFRNCIEDESVEKEIMEAKATSKKAGVHSTPTYYLNGKIVIGTKQLENEVMSILEGR